MNDKPSLEERMDSFLKEKAKELGMSFDELVDKFSKSKIEEDNYEERD